MIDETELDIQTDPEIVKASIQFNIEKVRKLPPLTSMRSIGTVILGGDEIIRSEVLKVFRTVGVSQLEIRENVQKQIDQETNGGWISEQENEGYTIQLQAAYGLRFSESKHTEIVAYISKREALTNLVEQSYRSLQSVSKENRFAEEISTLTDYLAYVDTILEKGRVTHEDSLQLIALYNKIVDAIQARKKRLEKLAQPSQHARELDKKQLEEFENFFTIQLEQIDKIHKFLRDNYTDSSKRFYSLVDGETNYSLCQLLMLELSRLSNFDVDWLELASSVKSGSGVELRSTVDRLNESIVTKIRIMNSINNLLNNSQFQSYIKHSHDNGNYVFEDLIHRFLELVTVKLGIRRTSKSVDFAPRDFVLGEALLLVTDRVSRVTVKS